MSENDQLALEKDAADMSGPDTIIKGLKAVARHFGRSERQVRRWAREPDFPRLSGKRFDLLQVQAWLDTRDGRPPMTRGPGLDNPQQPQLGAQRGKDFQEERYKRARADLTELDLRQRRRELVERREVEQLFIARIMAVKQGLLSMSRGLPPQLIHCQEERAMEIIIARAVRELLEEFSRPLPEGLEAPVQE